MANYTRKKNSNNKNNNKAKACSTGRKCAIMCNELRRQWRRTILNSFHRRTLNERKPRHGERAAGRKAAVYVCVFVCCCVCVCEPVMCVAFLMRHSPSAQADLQTHRTTQAARDSFAAVPLCVAGSKLQLASCPLQHWHCFYGLR